MGRTGAGGRWAKAVTAGAVLAALAVAPAVGDDELVRDAERVADEVVRRCGAGLVRAGAGYAWAWAHDYGLGPVANLPRDTVGVAVPNVEDLHREACAAPHAPLSMSSNDVTLP